MSQTEAQPQRPFRFFDNREKYLLFVTTCSEKWAIARRVSTELARIEPRPPALSIFDAGVGDATVLTRVLRDAHCRFPTIPHRVVGKEISLEDVRLSLQKMPDRLVEHPPTVLAFTNMHYGEAPNLMPRSDEMLATLNWWEIPLEGSTAHEFDIQIRELQSLIDKGWQTRTSARTGNPLYVTPSVLVIYRKDQAFVLDQVIPRKGAPPTGFDLVLASQPYRARSPAETKVRLVLAPLARALAPGGRMLVVQGTGRDPGMEIIREIWPDEDPFKTPRQELVATLASAFEGEREEFDCDALDDDDALFTFQLHAMPSELGDSIGTSTVLAAWNAAIYVAQIEDARLEPVLREGRYLEVTSNVLQREGGLWFLDESFVVTRRAA